jgi:hypothetical protein
MNVVNDSEYYFEQHSMLYNLILVRKRKMVKQWDDHEVQICSTGSIYAYTVNISCGRERDELKKG